MFSFAMTSGLASVFDKFKILITLRRVQLGEQASGRRWDCSGLDHVVRRCFGTKWYGEVPMARSTRDGDTGSRTTAVLLVF